MHRSCLVVTAAFRGAALPRRHFSVKVTTEMIKELRALTGAPMMECKAALSAADVNGELQLAVDWLRKKGIMAASKKAGRVAAEGLVGLVVSDDKLSAAVVEVRAPCLLSSVGPPPDPAVCEHTRIACGV
jgi:hypothetical protein